MKKHILLNGKIDQFHIGGNKLKGIVMTKLPHMLTKKVKDTFKRYGFEKTMEAIVCFINENSSAEYDKQYAQDLIDAHERYLERRKNKEFLLPLGIYFK